MNTSFPHIHHRVDFCVVGGGIPGLIAAIAAARHGLTVVLMQDRPVLGGNSSSEIRVHICGADIHNRNKHMRETGILEELRLENLYRNPNRSFSIWDTILYEKVLQEPNITLLLNCSCMDAEIDGAAIHSVTGWQLTTQTYHTVSAKIFADCSGDGVLAPLTGAHWRMGREARHEYDESIAPEQSDDRTMGMTCLFQTRKYEKPQPYEPPDWANTYHDCDELPYRQKGHRWWQMGYWWIELGGEEHSIHDTEKVRDELLKIAYGVWDHIKNYCPNRNEAANWSLEWVQFLPGKRESRRYIGEHILSQKEVAAGGQFPDIVGYGGWSMDDHHPAGFRAVRIGAPATIFHQAPSPYGIPYRSLYSRNIVNLMFAGRVASCTHVAMSSTRVMGTGATMGQAIGTAASIAIHKEILPAGVMDHIEELQQTLLNDDAYLPGIVQTLSELTTQSRLQASQGDPEPIRDGFNRQVGDDTHCWESYPGDILIYLFPEETFVHSGTLILDSGLDQNIQMSYHQKDQQLTFLPDVMPKAFRLQGLVNGQWQAITTVERNHRRFVKFDIEKEISGIRYILDETWGAKKSRLYAFYVE